MGSVKEIMLAQRKKSRDGTTTVIKYQHFDRSFILPKRYNVIENARQTVNDSDTWNSILNFRPFELLVMICLNEFGIQFAHF